MATTAPDFCENSGTYYVLAEFSCPPPRDEEHALEILERLTAALDRGGHLPRTVAPVLAGMGYRSEYDSAMWGLAHVRARTAPKEMSGLGHCAIAVAGPKHHLLSGIEFLAGVRSRRAAGYHFESDSDLSYVLYCAESAISLAPTYYGEDYDTWRAGYRALMAEVLPEATVVFVDRRERE